MIPGNDECKTKEGESELNEAARRLTRGDQGSNNKREENFDAMSFGK